MQGLDNGPVFTALACRLAGVPLHGFTARPQQWTFCFEGRQVCSGAPVPASLLTAWRVHRQRP